MRLRTLPLNVSLLLALALPLAAQQKRPMTFADLQAMKRVSDPQISPSGKWVLFSVTDVSLERNSKVNHLWVVPLDGSAKEHQVTFSTGESNGRFSPDGKQILYISANGGSQQIWLAPWSDVDGSIGATKQLTNLSTEADGAIWSPDSKSIAFTSDVYSDCSGVTVDDACNKSRLDEDAKSQKKALVFDSLLYRHWNQYQAPLAKLQLPPEQGFALAVPRLSHILMLHVDHPDKVFDLTPPFDWGNFIIAPTFSLGGPLGYAFSPDSKEMAFVVNNDKVPAESTNNDIYVIDVTLHDTKPSKPVTFAQGNGWAPQKVSTSPGSDDGPQYSPDGKWLAWRSQKRAGFESDKFRLFFMNRATGKITDVMPKFDKWVDEFIWSADSNSILFASGSGGEENVFSASILEHQANSSPEPSFSILQGEGELGSLVMSGNKLVGTQMKVDHPTELFIYDFTKPGSPTSEWAGEKPLTHLNDSLLDVLSLKPMQSFIFAGANGTKVQGFLIKPPNFDPAKKYPLKFLIHGGPQGAWGDAWSYRWNPELFAANGYVVVMINPRGSTGYGQQFVDEVSGDWGGRPYVDLMKGLDYAEKTYPFIDKERECALGASYGGFMADWVLTHTDRFKCIVTHDGMYNPQSAFGTTEELWFNEWEFRPLEAGNREQGVGNRKSNDDGDAVVEQTTPAHPWDFYDKPASEDPFRKWSPMLYIKNAKTPTLVIHGQKDYRLDVSEGLQLFDALQIRGVPSKMLYFPDEGHWVLKPQNSQLWYDTVNDWCDQWTHTNKYAK